VHQNSPFHQAVGRHAQARRIISPEDNVAAAPEGAADAGG
jgi:hypothetical protein